MYIHREGKFWVSLLLLVDLLVLLLYLNYSYWYILAGLIIMIIFSLLVLNFFRNPERIIPLKNEQLVYAPADGKIVVIEEVYEPEYFKDNRRQVSVFMNPLNVHVNRYPVSGEVVYAKYHPGKYLVAWHPKSSTENERTTVVVKNSNGQEILLRQVAGALAKRICCYAKEGDQVSQGDEMGFIKFGSRVDLYLPLNADIMTAIDQRTLGNLDVLAKLNP